MKWLELSVEVKPDDQELVSQIFMDLGVQGLEIVDPQAFRQVLEDNRYLDYADDGFIDSYGSKTIIKAYLHAESDIEAVTGELEEAFLQYGLVVPSVMHTRLRDDSEWKDNWKKHYKTFSISKRVVIKPTWEDYTPTADQIVIELEPGMAFGTGTHETTRMCAQLLDDLVKGQEKVLDLGCGTGILGIIAAKLGAADVIGVDIDDAACKTAEENARNNQVDTVVRVRQGELHHIPVEPYNVIIINIIADVILDVLPKLKQYCSRQTSILLSGIIRDRKQEVLEAVEQEGYKLVQMLDQGEWVAMKLCTDF